MKDSEECMGRFRSSGLLLAVAISAVLGVAGCGGGKASTPLYPGKVSLNPSTSTSLQLGGVIAFTGAVQTASGTNLNTTITYTSSDTSVVNISPTGVACGGHWDAAFTTCTAGVPGYALVTANALGGSSIPTYVFVHPPIDSVSVVGIQLNGAPVQEPCLSQSQSMTLEAHAYSQGSDITASVGPFVWTATNTSVVTLTPLNNSAFNFPTNQVTATAVTPGITYINASASGATSTSFQQPTITNSSGATSPVLDFFATCPIQNIALEVGYAGSGQTNLVVAKGGSAETIVATLTDIMGNSSLPNTNGGVVLSKVPLTWTSSQPGAIAVGTACTQSCALSTPSPGAATITASCSPPTCNVGFPVVPATLATPQQIATCSAYFQAIYPNFSGCQFLIPTPVYASNEVPGDPTATASPAGAISGLVTGSPAAPSVFATSTGCANQLPVNCFTSDYFFPLTKAVAGSENSNPVPLNSFLFDPAGDRIYAGSEFGAVTINPASFGSNNSAFSSLGTVNGKVLAVAENGNSAVFSDTIHTPNEVYVTSITGAPVALPIQNATVAAFSPDGLKAFIIGGTNSGSLYIYSSLQALQGPFSLAGPANGIAFSPNGAFAFIAEAANGASAANITAFANCSNQPVATLPLPANPIRMRVLPTVAMEGQDSYGYPLAIGANKEGAIHLLVLDSTGFDIAASQISAPATGLSCPQGLTFVSNDPTRPAQRVELGQTINQSTNGSPNFFASPDGTLLYVVNPGSSSIVVYSFIAGAITGGIELQGNATPITSDISADGGTIAIGGSDGLLHDVSTLTGGADLSQTSFPDIPNYLNAFCSITPPAGPCTLTTVLVKP